LLLSISNEIFCLTLKKFGITVLNQTLPRKSGCRENRLSDSYIFPKGVNRFLLALYAFHGRYIKILRPGSSVGIATGYELDGPGIESRWGERFSAPVQTGPGAHPASCTRVPALSRGKERPERDADPSPPSSAVVMKE
jgi:hypothetical protein